MSSFVVLTVGDAVVCPTIISRCKKNLTMSTVNSRIIFVIIEIFSSYGTHNAVMGPPGGGMITPKRAQKPGWGRVKNF